MSHEPRTLPVIQPGAVSQAPPLFDKIAVFGLGLVGGSIALAARRAWPSSLVIGVDDNDVLEKAMVVHAIDVAADDLIVAAEADLVVLAAPVRENIALLARLPEYLARPALITDVGSTKREIVEAARALPPRLTFIGGHPLGGAARAGIEFARPDLFASRPWIFTPETDRTASLDRLYAFAEAFGAVPRTLTPAEHDHALAYVSHLPQLAATALMHVVGEGAGEEALGLSGRGLADTTRLASSPSGIWRDICATNEDQIGAALDIYISRLQRIRENLRDADAIDAFFDEANRWREKLSK
jgi:prephenate dehydrogenase